MSKYIITAYMKVTKAELGALINQFDSDGTETSARRIHGHLLQNLAK